MGSILSMVLIKSCSSYSISSTAMLLFSQIHPTTQQHSDDNDNDNDDGDG
jgi:hypothetical protein